jgi:hypothetical protein
MAITIDAGARHSGPVEVLIEDYPNDCPLCHSSIHPEFLVAFAEFERDPRTVEAIFRCSKLSCLMLFVAYYEKRASRLDDFRLSRLAPITPREQTFSDEIMWLSPTFVRVYNQALAAEAYRLDQLAGTGYRKALEFLVKDCAIAHQPDKKAAIEKSLLGGVIGSCLRTGGKVLKASSSGAVVPNNDCARLAADAGG